MSAETGARSATATRGGSGAPPAAVDASVPDTLTALHVDPAVGLAAADVTARRAEHGANEIAEARPHLLRDVLRKFWGISAWMLELIIVLSAVLGNWADFGIVSALLVANAALGVWQERRAAGVVIALRRRLQVNARVLRASAWQLLPARELVPGDIVRVRAGDIVPADVKLISGALAVDASQLTGESREVEHGAAAVVASASVVRRGEGTGVVIGTGARTLFGRTTELVRDAQPRLHIEAVVARVVRWLFVIVGTLLVVVGALALLRGTPPSEMVPLLLVLLLSAVPVALPVMFTVSTALGSRELARHGVLVTRLSATEDAATMDVLCADKTGTITMNELAVVEVLPTAPATEADVLVAGRLASQEANQDPIDLAFIAAVTARHLMDRAATATPVSFAPFDATTRRTEAVVLQDGVRLRVMKGAVLTIAEACGLGADAITELEQRMQASADRGHRTLAVARGPEAGPMVLLGLVALYDPPRPDAAALVAKLASMGVAVKLLTGDALAVASEIGRGVGLPLIRRVADLRVEIAAAGTSAGALFANADGFAEVFPEDKYLVVRQLQSAGHVTGMTGDGVNDAPALRQAEVGIAVANATDVAKGAASVVLTEAGLANIVPLVEQGRMIYQRILTWIMNKISRTILKAAFVAIAFVVTGKFVVSAFAMLLLVFLTDFAKITIATDRVRPTSGPATWDIGGLVATSAVLGLAMVAETLLLLWIGWTRFGLSGSDDALHTFSFLVLLWFAVFSVISARERHAFWATSPSRPLWMALGAEALGGTALTMIGIPGLHALPLWQVGAVITYAAVTCLVVNDRVKVLLLRRAPRPMRARPGG